MTTEREAFEEFNYQLHGSSPFHIVYAKLENGRYVSPSIQYAWETWQARGEYESERTRKLVEALELLSEAVIASAGENMSNSERDGVRLAQEALRAYREENKRLREGLEGLLAGGFLRAGTRENSEWAQELAARIEKAQQALADKTKDTQ